MRYQGNDKDPSGQKIKAMKEELEKVKERALEVLANYEKTKGAIREDVKKEYARTTRHLENERARRESIIKDKIVQIDKLQNKIESLNNEILGLESKSKLWEHECARVCDVYHSMVRHYSNPGLVEVQLQVISEYTDALVRFVGGHKWGKDAADMARTYRDSIFKKLQDLVREIENDQEEDISLNSARRNVAGTSGKDILSPGGTRA